jgi:hypothetical protein
MGTRVRIPLVLLIWVIVGIAVAVNQNYGHIHNGSQLATFILAVVLWPILVFGGDVLIVF